jgi:hypothetical protein
MKFLKRMLCFLFGHKPLFAEPKAFILSWPSYDIHASLEICPRCMQLWGNVSQKNAALIKSIDMVKDELNKALNTLPNRALNFEMDKQEQNLPREIDVEFLLDPIAGNLITIPVVENFDLGLSTIEVETKSGKVVAWELDALEFKPSYSGEEQEAVIMQIGSYLNKVDSPARLWVSKGVFHMLDFSMFSPLAKTLGVKRYGVTGTGQTNVQGQNSSRALQGQSIGSFKVPGISGGNKL